MALRVVSRSLCEAQTSPHVMDESPVDAESQHLYMMMLASIHDCKATL